MKKVLTEQQVQDIIKKIDEASSNKVWESSSLLKAINKKLKVLRDNFLKANTQQEPEYCVDVLQKRLTQHAQMQEVYISLYSSEGNKLISWERILYNLSKHVISRPIYDNEEDIIKFIKTKDKPYNEAYIVIEVKKSDLLPPIRPDRVLQDKLGQPLLTLKDNSISLENVKRFVHLFVSYTWKQNKLFKID